MIFAARERRGSARFVVHKVVLFFLGAAVFLAGVLLRRDTLVLLAIPFLLAGIVLRFFEREPDPPETDDIEPDETGEDARRDDEGAAG